MDKPSPQRQHEDGFHALSCCPELEKCDTCDVLDFRYRLPFRPVIGTADKRQPIPVEVTLWFRLVRCPGPLALGDLVYSTTLLPGEKVRLFTSDRHTRFSFDTESKLAYRQHQSSEESYFAAGMAEAMSNLSIVENSNRSNAYHESSVSGGGGAGLDLGFVSFGGSVSASSYDALSTNTFARARPARRIVEPSHRGRHSRGQLDVDRRGAEPHPHPDRVGGSIRVGLATVCQSQPLPRGDLLLLPDQQVSDDPSRAGGYRAPGR